MSIGASLLRGVYRLSGVKKAFALPEEQLLKAIEKANRGRGFFMPTDHKAHYEKRMVNGFPCLIVQAESKPSQRAILFFFGGGMVIGPDKGDAAVLRKLCYGTGCDVWFPIYPLCTEHCITVSYDMAYSPCTATEMSAPAGFPPAARWHWAWPLTTARWALPCPRPGTLWPSPPARCRGTKRNAPACRR